MLLPEAIDANRIDFRNVYSITVYFTTGIIISFALAKVLASFAPLSEGIVMRASATVTTNALAFLAHRGTRIVVTCLVFGFVAALTAQPLSSGAR